MDLLKVFHSGGREFVFRSEDVPFGNCHAAVPHARGDVAEGNAQRCEVGGEGTPPGVGGDKFVLVPGFVLSGMEYSYFGVDACFLANAANRTVERTVGVLVLPGLFKEFRQTLFEFDGGFFLCFLADVRYVFPVDVFFCHGEDVGVSGTGEA